jgi:hypothetical protein
MARDEAFDRALGAAIKRHREFPTGGGRRLTQHELGVAVGMTPEGKTAAVTISRLESGAVGVKEARLRAIASALNTTAEELRVEAHASLLAEARETALEDAESAHAMSRVVRKTLGGPQAQDNYRRRLAIEAEVAERQDRTMLRLERLAEVQHELINDVVTPFLEQASQIERKVPPRPDLPDDVSSLPLDQRLVAHNESLSWQVANTLGTTALGAGTGAAVGGGAAAAIIAWVAASATASTGAAIGGLSGAAATSATLAWLGGGSLAAGGLGVAGGTLVLASIVTLPALIAAGGVFAYQARRMRRRAVEESDRIAEAEDSLRTSLPDLQRVWNWMIREQKVLEDLTTIGIREVRWLTKEVGSATQPIRWEEAPRPFKDRFERLSSLIVRCAAVLGLPILRDLDPEAAEDAERDERAQWIDLLLADAETLVEELEDAGTASQRNHLPGSSAPPPNRSKAHVQPPI